MREKTSADGEDYTPPKVLQSKTTFIPPEGMTLSCRAFLPTSHGAPL